MLGEQRFSPLLPGHSRYVNFPWRLVDRQVKSEWITSSLLSGRLLRLWNILLLASINRIQDPCPNASFGKRVVQNALGFGGPCGIALAGFHFGKPINITFIIDMTECFRGLVGVCEQDVRELFCTFAFLRFGNGYLPLSFGYDVMAWASPGTDKSL